MKQTTLRIVYIDKSKQCHSNIVARRRPIIKDIPQHIPRPRARTRARHWRRAWYLQRLMDKPMVTRGNMFVYFAGWSARLGQCTIANSALARIAMNVQTVHNCNFELWQRKRDAFAHHACTTYAFTQKSKVWAGSSNNGNTETPRLRNHQTSHQYTKLTSAV